MLIDMYPVRIRPALLVLLGCPALLMNGCASTDNRVTASVPPAAPLASPMMRLTKTRFGFSKIKLKTTLKILAQTTNSLVFIYSVCAKPAKSFCSI
jgi:type IV pilus biogenesis protein CpaD/CtpE